jgi:hypothetical protein
VIPAERRGDVGRQPPGHGLLAHEHAPALVGDDQALGPELVERDPDGARGDAPALDQFALTRQPGSRWVLAAAELLAERIRDLEIGRAS